MQMQPVSSISSLQVTCINGHKLILTTWDELVSDVAYQDGFACDTCLKDALINESSYHCSICRFDMCSDCGKIDWQKVSIDKLGKQVPKSLVNHPDSLLSKQFQKAKKNNNIIGIKYSFYTMSQILRYCHLYQVIIELDNNKTLKKRLNDMNMLDYVYQHIAYKIFWDCASRQENVKQNR